MKNKNCNKISIFVDNNNVPISFNIYSGNVNDARILYNELDNINPIIKKILNIYVPIKVIVLIKIYFNY